MSFRPDQPIQSSKEDLLGRHAFAQALADAICSYQAKNSIVVGLYGSWGCGKTSIVNMALEHISVIAKPKNEKPLIVNFNPWNYSDQNQLIAQFFKQLAAVLKKTDNAEEAKKVGSQLETYASFFEPLALISVPQISVPAVIVSKVFQIFGKVSKGWGVLKSKELGEVKKDLNKMLGKRSGKIIIVIDDIDRLNNIEIRQIFQLIKSLGDFPNTVYLLAFDKNVVINALSKVQEGSGEEYLEKIVQIPFEVPLADKQEIEKLFFNYLDQLIKDVPEEQWDQTYWGNIYHSGLKHFFTTIRDVTRYINSLRLSFEMIRGEINPVDFLAITGLQVFLPDVYIGIRDNKDIFVGASRDRGSSSQIDEDRRKCDDIISKAQGVDLEQLKDVLKRLFPRLESVYGGSNYGSDWLDNWRKAGRISSPELFDIFFRLSLPKNELSQKDITRIISSSNSCQDFAQELTNLFEKGKIIRFLERLEDYTEKDIAKENFGCIIETLINMGDIFPEGDTGFFGFDTPLRILRVTHQLLRRLPDHPERFSLLKSAFEKAERSLYTIVHEVSVQDQEHGKYGLKDKPRPEEKLTLNSQYLEELEKIACIKIKLWAQDGRLAKHKKLAGILYRWENWGTKEDVAQFIDALIKTDDGLVDFIASFLGKTISHGMSDYVGRVSWKISLDSIKHFIDLKPIEGRLRSIAKSEDFKKLSEEKQKAVNIFLDTLDGKVKNYPWDD